jgi:hypothetical protein
MSATSGKPKDSRGGKSVAVSGSRWPSTAVPPPGGCPRPSGQQTSRQIRRPATRSWPRRPKGARRHSTSPNPSGSPRSAAACSRKAGRPPTGNSRLRQGDRDKHVRGRSGHRCEGPENASAVWPAFAVNASPKVSGVGVMGVRRHRDVMCVTTCTPAREEPPFRGGAADHQS